jgi:hypothetical protein
MSTKEVIKSQYHASLEMLKQTIVKCPDSLWDHPDHSGKFWHVAYHVIFYTHLYLSPKEEDFVPWEKHREEYQFLGPLPWPPHDMPKIEKSYTKEEVLAYFEFCQEQVDPMVDALDLEAESGFYWLPFGKLELQFYNIRHVQHHAGELADRLGTLENIEIDWVGMRKSK